MKSVKISIRLPESWNELTDKQLYYVYSLMADNLSLDQIKTYCFFRWCGISVVGRYGNGFEIAQGKRRGYVDATLVAVAIRSLDWLGEFPEKPVRISKMKGFSAIDASLQDCNFPGHAKESQGSHRFTFEKYLYCDNLYQGYLETQRHDLLVQMAQLLYDSPKIDINQAEKISIFYWWASLKSLFSRTFCNFLAPLSTDEVISGGSTLAKRLQDATNAQIRALTNGDVTKRKEVLDLDVWPAMWELEAKAKEYNEMKAKYGK